MINSLEFASFLRQQTIQKKAESEVEELIAQASKALRGVWNSAITDVLTEAARFLRVDSLDQVTLEDIGILSSMIDESLGEGLISADQYIKMKALMQSSYIKGATSAAKGSGVTLQWGAPDQKSLNTISQNARYWINTYFDDHVQAGIDDVLKGHFAGGSSRRKVAESLKDHFQGRIKKDDNYWDLLADHTMTKTLEIGRVSGYEQAGIDYVKIDAVMDSRTSKICRVMNGRVIPVSSLRGQTDKYLSACDTGDKGKIKKSWPWVSDKQAETYKNYSTKKLVSSGVSLPPYHGRCRTITVSYFGKVPSGTPKFVSPKPKPKPKQILDDKDREKRNKEYEKQKIKDAKEKVAKINAKAKAKKELEIEAARRRMMDEAAEKAKVKAGVRRKDEDNLKLKAKKVIKDCDDRIKILSARGESQYSPTGDEILKLKRIRDKNEIALNRIGNRKGGDIAIDIDDAIKSKIYSVDEFDSVIAFTGEQYSKMRRAQFKNYSGKKLTNEENRHLVNANLLESMISENVQYNGELFRGIRVTKEQLKEISNRKIFSFDDQLTSTSIDMGIAEEFSWADKPNVGIIFKIKNGKGLAVDDISEIGGEQEVLMSGKSKFRVISSRDIGNNRWMIELEMI